MKTLKQRLIDRISEGAYPIRVDQINEQVEAWLTDYANKVSEESGTPDVKEWFYRAVGELKTLL
jgi:uncharacterized protein YbcC (UPF0753/DUF2309 family)